MSSRESLDSAVPGKHAPEIDFAKALAFVSSGSEAKSLANQALVLLAEERPDLRYAIYIKVDSKFKKDVGKTLTIEEAAKRVTERSRLLPFANSLFEWACGAEAKEEPSKEFRMKDLDMAGCIRLNRDMLLGELVALGIVEHTGSKYYYRVTERGQEVRKILKPK